LSFFKVEISKINDKTNSVKGVCGGVFISNIENLRNLRIYIINYNENLHLFSVSTEPGLAGERTEVTERKLLEMIECAYPNPMSLVEIAK